MTLNKVALVTHPDERLPLILRQKRLCFWAENAFFVVVWNGWRVI